MKRKMYLMLALTAITLSNSIPVFAGGWVWNPTDNGWRYEQDHGVLSNGWFIINGKWYYFNESGLMASDTVIDGYYVDKDGVWDGKEAVVGQAESVSANHEWTGHVHLVTNEMRGGIVKIYDPKTSEFLPQYNPAAQCFAACASYDEKGADVKCVIMNKNGTIVSSGYDDALWMTKDGYVRIKYCYAGTEQEANYNDKAGSDLYKVAIGLMDGSIYLEYYDWSGRLIDKRNLDEYDNYWRIEARKMYPLEKYTFSNVAIQCTPTEGGFILTDSQGQKAQILTMEDSANLRFEVIGNLLQFLRPTGECVGIYWIE